MATDYNLIAAEYKRAKQQPWRMYVEHFMMFELLGDLAGKSVLDLACGEGFFTRFIKQKGAARVVGMDLSEKMIELARQEESRGPLGIDYQVQDAQAVETPDEPFDIVTAGCLLNYASTRTELAEGVAVAYRIFLDDGPLDIINYHLAADTHAWAFREAGMGELKWHPSRFNHKRRRVGVGPDLPYGQARPGRGLASTPVAPAGKTRCPRANQKALAHGTIPVFRTRTITDLPHTA